MVENAGERHLERAIWLLPLYLLLINLSVVSSTLAGRLPFPDGQVDADSFVLAIPKGYEEPWLAPLVFLGGLSAATAMVFVQTIALSAMVSKRTRPRERGQAKRTAKGTSPKSTIAAPACDLLNTDEATLQCYPVADG